MDVKELIKGLNIEGLTDELKGQLEFLNGLCSDLDFSDEQREEIEKNIAIVKKNLPNLNAK